MDAEGRPTPQPPAGKPIPSLPPPSKVAEVVYRVSDPQLRKLIVLFTKKAYKEKSDGTVETSSDDLAVLKRLESATKQGDTYTFGLTSDEDHILLSTVPETRDKNGRLTGLIDHLLTVREYPARLNGGRTRKARKSRKSRRKSRRAH